MGERRLGSVQMCLESSSDRATAFTSWTHPYPTEIPFALATTTNRSRETGRYSGGATDKACRLEGRKRVIVVEFVVTLHLPPLCLRKGQGVRP